eukprot:1150170-Pelagomonas_calceolata.AAC.3
MRLGEWPELLWGPSRIGPRGVGKRCNVPCVLVGSRLWPDGKRENTRWTVKVTQVDCEGWKRGRGDAHTEGRVGYM